MAEKRYAIVSVKHICPLFENNELCDTTKNCFSCKINTNYGDTKEQLLNKIETAIKRKLKGGYSVTYRKFGKGYIKDSVSARELAESIVEFLGVVE